MLTFTLKAPRLDKDAFSCLFDNLELIRSKKDFIMSRKKYRDIRISGIFVAGLYVGGKSIPLGILLELWNKTNWHTDNRFYCNIIGSPLSGMNNCCWFDMDTKQLEFGRVEKWHILAPVAFRFISQSADQKSRNRQLEKWREMNERNKCTFAQWSKNMDKGKITHIPKPKPSLTLTIYELVDLLKQTTK